MSPYVLLAFIVCALVPSVLSVFPTNVGTQAVTATIAVSGTYDGKMKRFYGSGALGSSDQDESQPPIFEIANKGIIKNVIIGSPAADGIHCLGECTIENVWWEDVGEDAATFKGQCNSGCFVKGGGARKAEDKVFQHNGKGTVTISNFELEDFGKLFRSCGNCDTQNARHVIVKDVVIIAPGKTVVGINTNYGDTATLSGITVVGDSSKKIKICEKFKGVTDGEPTSIGSGPDSTNCKYTTSSVTYTNTIPASSAGGSSSSGTPSSTSSASSGTTGGIPSTNLYKISNKNSGKCMDVKSASTADGGDVIQYSCSGANNQLWQFINVEGEYYYIKNKNSGKYLDLENCNAADGANVRQWSALNNNCQQWLRDNVSSGVWRFYNRASGKVLEVSGCSTADGGDVRQWTHLNNACQQWILTKV